MQKSPKNQMKFFTLTIAILLLVLTRSSVKGEAATEWTRSLEPVTITGIQVFRYLLVDVNHVFAYSYQDGAWSQIPLQIDEVDLSGNYVTSENSVIDLNDELVFMAMDLGERVGEGIWIPDDVSRNYPRYELEVTDPLNTGEVGYVYLYRSSTLTKTHGDYVTWDDEEKLISAGTYNLGLSTEFGGIESLELNGNEIDVLDRSKLRLDGVCKTGGGNTEEFHYNEDSLASEGEDLLELDPSIDGPVRAGGGTQSLNNWFYDSMHINNFNIDFNALDDVVCEWSFLNFGYIESFRFSLDWLDPIDTGMEPMMYFDSNTADGESIDGVTDSIPTLPLNPWTQATGSLGSVVRVTDTGPYVTGTVMNYYKDDSTVDIFDTGDSKSFGDSGVKVEWPPETPKDEYGTLWIGMTSFILDPDQPNLGDTYAEYPENPLEVAISRQDFMALILRRA